MEKENYIIKLIVSYFVIYCIIGNIYAYNFNDIIDIVGIPRINKNFEEINEDIYNKYNVFVYSNPIEVLNKTNMQRFKAVPNKGKYLFDEIEGEFYILGTNLDGKYVYNVYFPVDFVPETLPDNWNYIYYEEYRKSWDNNYLYEEQIEYMKNTKLMFDKINLENKTCDSYNFVEYDVIPNKIGLGKFRLNTPATWKTMGIVTAKRKVKNGSIREVVFATKPMAINASVKSSLDINDKIYLNEEDDKKVVNIKFGAEAINLNEYTKKEHIKKINSEIYINGEYIDSISGSKTTEVDKNIEYVVSRNKSSIDEENFVLKVEVKSYLYTEFLVDGLMYDIKTEDIEVKIAPKKLVPVKNIKLNLLKKQNEIWVVSPLVQTSVTNSDNSMGFIEQGRKIAILLEFYIEIEKVKEVLIYINGNKFSYNVLKKENNCLIIEPHVDNLGDISIAGYNTLRSISGNYLNIKRDDIGMRIKEPNKIDIVVYLNISKYEYRYTCLFDVFDNYLDNINYRYCKSVLNKEELKSFYVL